MIPAQAVKTPSGRFASAWRHLLVIISCLAARIPATAAPAAGQAPAESRPRLIVLADMGNEPDEVQQMLHLLVCSNMVELEGLVAVTGKYLRPEHRLPYRRSLHPELFHELIDGYAKVVANLQRHAPGWPTADHLRSIVTNGQTGYGIADTGEGKSSSGSQLIITAATRDDPRSLHVVVNAGSNTLAQALRDFRAAHSAAETTAFVAKLRVFENGAQDNAGAWICHEFPEIFWVRSNHQTYCYGGPTNENLGPHTWAPHAYSADGQDAWAHEHVRTGHGALGELFPVRRMGDKIHFMEGGGTIPWMGFVARGLSDTAEPSWGGWSGRFSSAKITNVWSRHADIKADEQANVPFAVYTEDMDHWTNPIDGQVYHDSFAPVWRWRQAMWNDLQVRMDWCVRPFAQANHHPRAALNGDTSTAILRLAAKPGDELKFDASASTDPDGNALLYSWWVYPEAGRSPYGRSLLLAGAATPQASFTVPADAAGRELHLILEVTDRHPEVPLTSYRRVVITVD